MQSIRYLKHKEIDFEKWNNTILNSNLPLVFAQSFYLDAVSPNWDALVINDYESVFPLTLKSKFGIRYFTQPPFTSQLGTYGKKAPEIEQLFFERITKEFKLIDLELNAENTLSNQYISAKKTFVIRYENGYTLNKNSKRNIQYANEQQLKVIRLKNQEIISSSSKYLNPFLKKKLSMSDKTIHVFEQLLNSAMRENKLVSFAVTDEKNNFKAIAHFIYNQYHAFFLKGTVINKAENSGSMHLLLNHAVQFFCDKAQLFDFGGGSNSDSLAAFYKGLGGKQLEYGFLRWNQLPKFINLIKSKI